MIRLKIIFLVLVSIVVLSLTMYVVSTTIILKSYQAIENNAVQENLIRVQGAIDNYNTALNIKLRDWAQWDDSYVFIQDNNDEYRESNLRSTALLNLEINLMLFVHKDSSVAFSKIVELQSGAELPSETFGQIISRKQKVTTHQTPQSSVGGIMLVNGDLLILQSLPILQSSGEGPIEGTIIFGRFLDQEMQKGFEELTQLDIEVFTDNGLALPDDVAIAKKQLTTDNKLVTQVLSEKEIAGYITLYDIEGQSVGTLRIVMPRHIYNQGKATLLSFITIASIVVLLFGVIIIVLIEKLLIYRFNQLSKEVTAIKSDSDLSEVKVFEGKNDDIGKLARKINTMLMQLAISHNKLDTSNKMEKIAHEKLHKQLQETENINKLMVNRELKMIELKKEIEDLRKKIDV